MIVGKGLYNILSNSVGVTNLVGTNIFPEIAPPDINPPYIVYSVISNTPTEVKENGNQLDTASVEIYSFETSYEKAVDLGVMVRTALDRRRSPGTAGFGGVQINSIEYTNEQMDVNEKRDIWVSIQDYSVRIINT
tara:strand:- start:12070 stop:12474 length:405 start_codon:yes stop_codon:yes gene_type:complete